MSYIEYDKFGRSEHYFNVSGKNKLQVENFSQLKSTVNTIKDQLKEIAKKTMENVFIEF